MQVVMSSAEPNATGGPEARITVLGKDEDMWLPGKSSSR